MFQIKFNMYIFTILARIYINVVKPVTDIVISWSQYRFWLTSFADLMICTFRFTDNVQRSISRYLQVNRYVVSCDWLCETSPKCSHGILIYRWSNTVHSLFQDTEAGIHTINLCHDPDLCFIQI